jgi:hypothetical protein
MNFFQISSQSDELDFFEIAARGPEPPGWFERHHRLVMVGAPLGVLTLAILISVPFFI